MSEGYLADKLFEALGAEKFSGEEEAPTTWSPNMYKSIYILPEAIIAEHHLDGHKIEAVSLDSDELDVLDESELSEVLGVRNLGTLEAVYVHPSLGGIESANLFSKYINLETSRFHEVGEVNGFDGNGKLAPSKVMDVAGSDGWESRFNLQPEHYKMDTTGGKLWSHFDKIKNTSGSAVEDGSEDTEEVDPLVEEAISYFSDTVKGTVEKIMSEYSKIFSSGYEVIQPVGVIVENNQGRGVVARVSADGKLTKDNLNRNIQYVYEDIKKRMGLTEVPVRKVGEIANTVYNGKPDADSESYNGTLTFPYKMLEYAFGCSNQTTSGSLTEYPPHSMRTSWDTYADAEVVGSVTAALNNAIMRGLKSKKLIEDYASDEANMVVSSITSDFQRAFCTVIVVSTYDITKDSLVSLKVRVLDPTGRMPRHENILEDVLIRSRGSIDGSPGLMIYKPRVDGEYFVEYHIELDTKLANAEPLFAYKALQSMKKRGKSVSYDNAILGKMSDDSILTNGGPIDLRKKLSHAVVAGSRAGKGVWTFSILCSAVLSKRAIFYNDNKPDMASTFRKYGPEGFVINGHNLLHDPENGNDYFSQFTNEDALLNPNTFPPYLREVFGGNGYSDVGSYVYLRSLIFTLGILAARVGAPQALNELGGKDGITIVVDELALTNGHLMGIFTRSKQLLALQEYAASVRDGNKPKNDRPSKASYWWTSMYEMLERSVTELQSLSRAGLKNIEANRSDIFILTQEPPQIAESSEDFGGLFVERSKGSQGARRSMENNSLLPTLALLGGTDVFIGYDKDKRAFLDQKNPQSKAYEHLNEVSRGFGYVQTYDSKTRDNFNTARLAETALYYRPMLVFADGGKDNYFARNALKNAELAGIEDPRSIIERNSAPDDKNEFHEGIGFKGYLNEAGLSDSEISGVLNESGAIAQRVVDKMGYPGTWREFIMDFRPEWLFTVKDIVEAMKGSPLNQDLKNRSDLWEFLLVYPEEFGIGSENSDEENSEYFGSDDFETKDYGSNEPKPQFIGQEYSDFDEDGYDSQTNEPTNHSVVDEYTGTEAGTTREYSAPVVEEKAPEIPVDNSDTYSRGTGEQPDYPANEWSTQDFSEGEAVSSPDWSTQGDEAIDRLNKRLENGEVNDVINNSSYGSGYNTDPMGNPDNYRNNRSPNTINIEDTFDNQNPGTSIARIMQSVMEGILRNYGSYEGIKSIRIIGTTVVINNMVYNDKLPKAFLDSLPVDMRAEVSGGNLAKLIDWNIVKTRMKGIVRLSFDNVMYAYDYVAPGMGWGSRVSVDSFFNGMRRLKMLTIGDQVFDRSTYKEQLRNDDTFYQPRAIRRISDSVDKAFANGVGKTWKYTSTSFNRSDIGAGRKFLMVTGGLVGTGVTGTATLASKTTRGLFTGIKAFSSGIKEMLDESKNS